MFNDKKGNVSVLVFSVLMIIVWILFTPMINDVIEQIAPNTGSATLFFIRLIAWVMLLLLVMGAISLGKNLFGQSNLGGGYQ